jgi:hypothetical protein
LHRVKIIRLTDPLQRGDLIAFMQSGQRETGKHAPAINVHCAGPALAMIASLLRAGQLEMLAEAIQERSARIDPQIVLLAINPERNRDRVFRFGCRRLLRFHGTLFGPSRHWTR